MRVPKSWIQPMARKVASTLLDEELIITDLDLNGLTQSIEGLIFDELSIEDRINEEVREMLKQFDTEIDKGRLDYRKLFDLTKKKLVRERNVIL